MCLNKFIQNIESDNEPCISCRLEQESSFVESSRSSEFDVGDDNEQLLSILDFIMGVIGKEMREFLSLSSCGVGGSGTGLHMA